MSTLTEEERTILMMKNKNKNSKESYKVVAQLVTKTPKGVGEDKKKTGEVGVEAACSEC